MIWVAAADARKTGSAEEFSSLAGGATSADRFAVAVVADQDGQSWTSNRRRTRRVGFRHAQPDSHRLTKRMNAMLATSAFPAIAAYKGCTDLDRRWLRPTLPRAPVLPQWSRPIRSPATPAVIHLDQARQSTRDLLSAPTTTGREADGRSI
jgi:hypothetical protein